MIRSAGIQGNLDTFAFKFRSGAAILIVVPNDEMAVGTFAKPIFLPSLGEYIQRETWPTIIPSPFRIGQGFSGGTVIGSS